jgi:hypothetical protein
MMLNDFIISANGEEFAVFDGDSVSTGLLAV